MKLRAYDPERDRDAVRRIWREVGWVDKSEEERVDGFMTSGRALVAEMDGEAESAVCSVGGTTLFLDEELPGSYITGVTTSYVGRKQGFASRLTARLLAEDAAAGAILAGLGMFEQGYYTRLGFGTGGYERWLSFDPADLQVPAHARPPKRIRADEWQAAHAARLARWRWHGACNLAPAQVTRGEMSDSRSFGLGYYDGPDGALSHYAWIEAEGVEFGPYRVSWMVYRDGKDLLELLAMIAALGDQVSRVQMREPPQIQLQDLLRTPFKRQRTTERSRFEVSTHASAYWQVRMLDVPACLAKTHLPCEPVRFALRLADPVEAYLPVEDGWRGVAGDYIITLGPESRAERGEMAGLPVLQASVGSFTRLWAGIRPATSLALTDDLKGPAKLLDRLDRSLRLPDPKPDWDF